MAFFFHIHLYFPLHIEGWEGVAISLDTTWKKNDEKKLVSIHFISQVSCSKFLSAF